MNFANNTTRNWLFLAILFSFLTVVGWGSVAYGDLLNAPRGATNVTTRTADDVNLPFIEKGWQAPYGGRNVREFVTSHEMRFVRVHGEGNKARSWMMRADDVEGLSPAQVRDKFALPDLPTHISDVHVPAGTRIRVGKVAPQEGWGTGGAYQYELLQRLGESAFRNTRPLQ